MNEQDGIFTFKLSQLSISVNIVYVSQIRIY